MNCQNLILDAIDVALFWDLSEEALTGAVNARLACSRHYFD